MNFKVQRNGLRSWPIGHTSIELSGSRFRIARSAGSRTLRLFEMLRESPGIEIRDIARSRPVLLLFYHTCRLRYHTRVGSRMISFTITRA
jgi:hypothetical protein